MKSSKLAWIPVVLIFVSTAFGQLSLQNNLPYKDLIFAQLAAGGQYETWITVTNRGTATWNGTFQFFHNKGEAWNPIVNGVQISGGILQVSIPAKQTKTYKVTLPTLASGFVVARADDADFTNYLEGTLTYYVTEGGVMTDSVGVQPSRPFLASSLPFEDFGAICLAFANTDAEGRSANVKFRVYSPTGIQQGPTREWSNMVSMEHKAQYLFELFPEISKTYGRGRLEVESDVPISGMALTLISQMSSLPLNSTTRTYSVDSYGDIHFAAAALWTEGLFVNGYITFQHSTDPPVLMTVSGDIRNGKLHLSFGGVLTAGGINYTVFGYIMTDTEFDPASLQFSGTYYVSVAIMNWNESSTFTAYLVD